MQYKYKMIGLFNIRVHVVENHSYFSEEML